MKYFAVCALFCLVAAVHCDIDLDIGESGIKSFKYSTGDAGQHSREEKIEADGSVSGSFSYVDANGDLRKTEYKAGPGGFQPSGDISVDKKTAEKAKELEALAPKAPVEEKVDLKIPASPFTLPLYALPGIHTPVAAPWPYAIHHPLAYQPLAHHPIAHPHAYTSVQYW